MGKLPALVRGNNNINKGRASNPDEEKKGNSSIKKIPLEEKQALKLAEGIRIYTKDLTNDAKIHEYIDDPGKNKSVGLKLSNFLSLNKESEESIPLNVKAYKENGSWYADIYYINYDFDSGKYIDEKINFSKTNENISSESFERIDKLPDGDINYSLSKKISISDENQEIIKRIIELAIKKSDKDNNSFNVDEIKKEFSDPEETEKFLSAIYGDTNEKIKYLKLPENKVSKRDQIKQYMVILMKK